MNLRLLKRTSFVLAAALVLAACSSSSKNSSSSPTTAAPSSPTTAAPSSQSSTSSAATPTGSPIVIGGVCDCTSPFGNIAEDFEPYRAWVNYVNASGGINGHPVKFM